MKAQADLDANQEIGAVGLAVHGEEPDKGAQVRMDSTKVLGQLDSLIDDLLNDGDLPASSLASMLMAARDSVKDGYHFALARRVWDASNAIRDRYSAEVCVSNSSCGSHEPD